MVGFILQVCNNTSKVIEKTRFFYNYDEKSLNLSGEIE